MTQLLLTLVSQEVFLTPKQGKMVKKMLHRATGGSRQARRPAMSVCVWVSVCVLCVAGGRRKGGGGTFKKQVLMPLIPPGPFRRLLYMAETRTTSPGEERHSQALLCFTLDPRRIVARLVKSLPKSYIRLGIRYDDFSKQLYRKE